MPTPSMVDVLFEDAELIATEAVEAIRREVPALLKATSPELLLAGIRAGIGRFAAVWREGRGWHPAELRELVAPTLALHGAVAREDALHAMRVIIEVCRQHEARWHVLDAADPSAALAVLRQAETARQLSSALIHEVDTGLHRADVGSGRARDRIDAEVLALLLDRPAAPHVAASLAREHGLDLAGAWVVAVGDASGAEGQRALVTRCATEREGLLTALRGTYLVVVARQSVLGHLQLPQPVGLSRSGSVAGLRDAFDQALGALTVSRRRGAPTSYDEALVDLVLLGSRPATELTARLVEALADPDPERTAWLLETLEAYLDEATSVTAAARRLTMHRESFRYRLQQLDARLGEELHTPAGRLGLHMAVRALRCGVA